MENDLKKELCRRRRAAWAASGPLREATDQLEDPELRAHLFDSRVLPGAETWADAAATSETLRTTHRACCLLRYNRPTQHQAGLRSSDLRRISRLRDPAEYVSKTKHDGLVTLRGEQTIDERKELWNGSLDQQNDLEGDHQRDGPMCSLHGWAT